MLDQLRRIDVGDDDGGVERRVDFLHGRDGALGFDADDDPIRLHQVLHRETFPQKLRVAHHVELHLRFAVAFNGLLDLVAGLDRHGAFIDDDLVGGHGSGDLTGDLFDETEVNGPIRQGWSGDGDEDNVGFADAFSGAGGEAKAPRSHVLFDELFEAGFVDGDPPFSEEIHFGGVVIHADDVVSDLGEASARNQTDVTRSDNSQLHVT